MGKPGARYVTVPARQDRRPFERPGGEHREAECSKIEPGDPDRYRIAGSTVLALGRKGLGYPRCSRHDRPQIRPRETGARLDCRRGQGLHAGIKSETDEVRQPEYIVDTEPKELPIAVGVHSLAKDGKPEFRCSVPLRDQSAGHVEQRQSRFGLRLFWLAFKLGDPKSLLEGRLIIAVQGDHRLAPPAATTADA